MFGTSLVAQRLRLCSPRRVPRSGTGSHVLQLRVSMSQLKIPHAAMKTRYNEINKYFLETSVFDYMKFQKFTATGTTEK